jgi:hypothetical protein
VLGTLILFSFLIANFSFGQSFNIELEANLKKEAYDDSKLLFQNITLTFGNSSICYENNCKYEIRNGTLDIFGNYLDIDGTLKIEDKSKFDPQNNSTYYNYFDLSGSFRLDSSKENQTQKINYYGGEFKLEKRGIQPLTFPFIANVTLTQPGDTFLLMGNYP